MKNPLPFAPALGFGLLIFSMSLTALQGEIRSPEESALAARNWMIQHPIFEDSGRELGERVLFPEEGDYQLVLFRLEPSGYLVLHTDDRLPLMVAYSADSSLSLEDVPENSFRAFLERVVAGAEERLAALDEGRLIPATVLSPAAVDYPEGDFVVGPLIEASWNQNDPYNLYAPDSVSEPNGSYYDGRLPIGCVPLAFAQILYYHRWPLYGEGSRSYTDNSGSTTGFHSVDFSDSYDWDNLKGVHSSSDTQLEQEAIGELVYELAVAVGANFEEGGTGASVYTMRSRLADYFRFESSDFHGSYATLQESLDSDLLAGYPCVVTIPGHAVVADGILRNGNDVQYHINYGWGGTNNGWFAYNAIPPGTTLEDGVTSLRPEHIAVPVESVVAIEQGADADLQWILPKRRNKEVERIRILQEVSGDGRSEWATLAESPSLELLSFSKVSSVWEDGNAFDLFQITSTSDYRDWAISAVPGIGEVFYKEPGGYSNRDYHLTSQETLHVASAQTRLSFRIKYILANDPFRVMVSTDGEAFAQVAELRGSSDWRNFEVDLADYAGQDITVRLEYVPGSYYPSGGVWIDAITVEEVSLPEYEDQPVHQTTLAGLPAGSYRLAAQVVRVDGTATPLGPALDLVVEAASVTASGTPYSWLIENGLASAEATAEEMNAAELTDCAGKGFPAAFDYLAGTDPNDPLDRLEFSHMESNGAEITLRWLGVAGRTYEILCSDSMGEETWACSKTIECLTDGETLSATLSIDGGVGFFRIGVRLTQP